MRFYEYFKPKKSESNDFEYTLAQKTNHQSLPLTSPNPSYPSEDYGSQGFPKKLNRLKSVQLTVKGAYSRLVRLQRSPAQEYQQTVNRQSTGYNEQAPLSD